MHGMSGAVLLDIRRLPHHVLASALPQMRPFDCHSEVRQEFIRWVASRRRDFGSWQEAWNEWTHATARQPGAVELTVLCPECRGRMFSTRSLTRGIPGGLCTQCQGRRRVRLHSIALWQKVPKSCESADQHIY